MGRASGCWTSFQTTRDCQSSLWTIFLPICQFISCDSFPWLFGKVKQTESCPYILATNHNNNSKCVRLISRAQNICWRILCLGLAMKNVKQLPLTCTLHSFFNRLSLSTHVDFLNAWGKSSNYVLQSIFREILPSVLWEMWLKWNNKELTYCLTFYGILLEHQVKQMNFFTMQSSGHWHYWQIFYIHLMNRVKRITNQYLASNARVRQKRVKQLAHSPQRPCLVSKSLAGWLYRTKQSVVPQLWKSVILRKYFKKQEFFFLFSQAHTNKKCLNNTLKWNWILCEKDWKILRIVYKWDNSHNPKSTRPSNLVYKRTQLQN